MRPLSFVSVLLFVCSAGCTNRQNLGARPDAGSMDGRDGSLAGDASAMVHVNDVGACPHIDLGSRVPVTWEGSTDGLPNYVESSRLEWQDAPDDSLMFTAPEDGNYVIHFESTNAGFGVSAREYGPEMNGRGPYYTPSDCPLSGQVKLIDGVYNDNQPDYPLELVAGQTILLWVSGTYWADAETTSYTLRIDNVAEPDQRKVFVTSSRFTGDLGGLSGADAQCQQHANDAGLGGTWMAWLSTPSSDAIDRLGDIGPWYALDGTLFFTSRAQIAAFSQPENSLWLDEDGSFLASDRIWTGTGADGRYVSSIGDSCQSWTSRGMSDQARIGQVGRLGSEWTSYSFTTCDQSNIRLLCFEQ